MIDESLMHRAVTALETHAIALNRQADALEKVVEIVAVMQKDLNKIASCVISDPTCRSYQPTFKTS